MKDYIIDKDLFEGKSFPSYTNNMMEVNYEAIRITAETFHQPL